MVSPLKSNSIFAFSLSIIGRFLYVRVISGFAQDAFFFATGFWSFSRLEEWYKTRDATGTWLKYTYHMLNQPCCNLGAYKNSQIEWKCFNLQDPPPMPRLQEKTSTNRLFWLLKYDTKRQTYIFNVKTFLERFVFVSLSELNCQTF